MQLSNAPGKLVLPFANAGAKNTIPAASQIGITAGAASLTDGFPPLTRTPIAAGGVPPSGLDMNGILYALSAALRWANAGGGYVYDSTFAADSNVGGYPKGARVLRSDGAGYWLNTIDGNTVDPESVTVNQAQIAGWVPDLTNGVAAVTMTSANVTLTPLQYGKPIIVLSGTLTANLNLIFPNLAGEWTVVNNCTGAFTVTAKTAAGTGAVVTPGRTRIIWGDGTNIAGAMNEVETPADLVNTTQIATAAFANKTGAPVGTARNAKMIISAASATATFTADEITIETALGGAPFRLANFNKTINLATTGAGGMDTGAAPASGYVALYAIYNPTTQTSALLATNATSSIVPQVYGGANMPAGYGASALVSVWPTNASSQFVIGSQKDRKIQRTAVAIFNATAASFTAVSISAAVPPNAVSVGGFFRCITNTAGGGTLDLASDANGVGLQPVGVGGVTNLGASGVYENLQLMTQQTIYYRTLNMGSADANVTSYAI